MIYHREELVLQMIAVSLQKAFFFFRDKDGKETIIDEVVYVPAWHEDKQTC